MNFAHNKYVRATVNSINNRVSSVLNWFYFFVVFILMLSIWSPDASALDSWHTEGVYSHKPQYHYTIGPNYIYDGIDMFVYFTFTLHKHCAGAESIVVYDETAGTAIGTMRYEWYDFGGEIEPDSRLFFKSYVEPGHTIGFTIPEIDGVSSGGFTIQWHFCSHGFPTTDPKVPDLPELDPGCQVSLRLYDGPNRIDTLIRTFGTISWDRTNSIFDELSMKLTIDYNKSTSGSIRIILPEGFSFQSDGITRSKVETISPGTNVIIRKIYPLYCQTSGFISISGDISCVLQLSIVDNVTAGDIYMRPTLEVNKILDYTPLTRNIYIDPVDTFTGDSTEYSDSRLVLGAMLSQSVYNENGDENSGEYIRDSLQNLGFSNIEWKDNTDPHGVAVCFGNKIVLRNSIPYNVIAVVVRGTSEKEWIGNFNVTGDYEDLHNDFAKCCNDVSNKLTKYISTLKIGSTANSYPKKIFVCGHSRAGAVVDLLAHSLNNSYGQKNVYAYTYAAPNSTKTPCKDENIYNYIYKYDFVPFVPHGDYKKHGINIVVGDRNEDTAPESVAAAFEDLDLSRKVQSGNTQSLELDEI